MKLSQFARLLPVLLLLAARASNAEEVVDVELVLAADVSYSMQAEELKIQHDGYASALVHPSVLSAIRGGLHQKIALTYIEWAGDGSQRIIVPWTLIAGPGDAERVAAMISAPPIGAMRRTSISGAIDFSAGLFKDNGFRGLKRVIDISGDGPNNQGRPVAPARDAAVETGIIINGLPLMTNHGGAPYAFFNIPDLDRYYTDCVIGGPGSFVMPVTDWNQFAEAVRRKLVLELAGDAPRYPGMVVLAAAREPYDCLIGEKLWERRQFFLDMR